MRTPFKTFLAVSLFYLGICALLAYRAYALAERNFVYPLDDTYIHMALAKNLVQHGVFGVTQYEYSAAASSVLWPWVLALFFKLFGLRIWLPLALNLALGLATLAILSRGDGDAGVGKTPHRNFLLAVFFCLLVPLPTMTMIAMEHLLHILATIWFARVVCKPEARISGMELVLSAMLLTGARYEGLFLVAAAAGLFILQRRWKWAAIICGAGWVLPALQGAISLRHGSSFLPNSLLMKAGIRAEPAVHLLDAFSISPALATLVIAAFVLLVIARNDQAAFKLKLFLITAALHFALARGGWLWRYEAYLIALGIWSCWPALESVLNKEALVARWDWPVRLVGAWIAGIFVAESVNLIPILLIYIASFAVLVALLLAVGLLLAYFIYLARRKAWDLNRPASRLALMTLLALLAFGPAIRAVLSFRDTPLASRDIYLQSIQVARFVEKNLNGAGVVLHDVGAVTYFADIHCLDTVGLASAEVVALKRRNEVTGQSLQQLAHEKGMQYAIVYEVMLPAPPPSDWIKVEDWRLENMVVLGNRTMSFYGIGKSNADRLDGMLAAFTPQLPKEVAVVRPTLSAPSRPIETQR